MADNGFLDWSGTAAVNVTTPSGINWTEGQLRPTINNSARQEMADLANWRDDNSGVLETAGSTTAYTLASATNYASLVDGLSLKFRIDETNTGASTLNVNSLGAKDLTKGGGDAVGAGDLVEGSIYEVVYVSADDNFRILNGHPIPLASDISIAAISGLSATNIQDALAQLAVAALNAGPTGMIAEYAGTSAPTGWLLCYGQNVSRTTYANLFTAISTTYGVGDGSTTFALPDHRGNVVAGKGDMGGSDAAKLTASYFGAAGTTIGATGGSESHTLTGAEVAGHTHTFSGTSSSDGAHTHTVSGTSSVDHVGGGSDGAATGADVKFDSADVTTSSNGAHTHTFSGTTSSTGSGGAHNNVQPTIIHLKIIKF